MNSEPNAPGSSQGPAAPGAPGAPAAPVAIAPHAPPSQPGRLPASPTTWPTVLGVIGILWATLTIFSSFCAGAMPFLMPLWQEMAVQMRPGATAPPDQGRLGYAMFPAAVVGICFAILLMSGATALVRRRGVARRRLRLWAILALCWLPIGMVLGLFATPGSTMQFSTTGPNPQIEQSMQRFGQAFGLTIGFLTGLAPPVFVLVWFARRSVKDEVCRWPDHGS